MITAYERVYKDRDNYTEVGLYRRVVEGACREAPLDLSAVSRMVLTLTPDEVTDDIPEIEVDSDLDADAMDWLSGDTGTVKFTLGDIDGDTTTQYTATLVAYDAAHPSGQVLLDGEYPIHLVFTFYEV